MIFDFLKGKKSGLEEKIKEHLVQNSAKSKLEYLKILDSYGVSWSMEKAVRDTLQNFFDANNSTLDGINVILTNEDDNYTIRIHGRTEYDFRRLTHLGGTTKFNNEFTAGSFGEGTKILALVLLRDYDFSQIRFGSQNWELDFLLKELPKGEYVEQRKGLFALLNQKEEKFPGNFIEFKTKNKDNVKIFAEAKELFYSSKNQDFQSPSLDISGVGGLKYLPREEGSLEIPCGNFYYAGQRRHFEVERWNTVEHFNVWTYKNDILNNNRDRGTITRGELCEIVIPEIINSSSNKNLIKLVYEMKPIWSKTKSYHVGSKILKKIIEKLHENKVRLKFEDKYFSLDGFLSNSLLMAFENQGYVICPMDFQFIGMKSVKEKFSEMQEHYKLEPTPEEKVRFNVLYESGLYLGKTKKTGEVTYVIGRGDKKSAQFLFGKLFL